MKPLKKAITVTLDIPILERLREEAEYQDRSMSSYINLLLRDHFERLDKKRNG